MAEEREKKQGEGPGGSVGAAGGEIFLRNHITYIIEKAWSVILVFAVALLSNEELWNVIVSMAKKEKLDENMQMYFWVVIAVLVFFLILAVWFLNRWYHTTMTVKDGSVTYRQILLTKKSNTMSVKQISNVNIEQNIFEMIFGTCKLRLDTDSLSTADSTDMEMILKKKKAEQVKRLLLAMKEGEDVQDVPEEADDYDIVYTVPEMLINGLLSVSVKQFVLAVGLIITFAVTLKGMLENVARGDFEGIGAGLVVLLTEFLTAYSLVWAIFKKIFMDFRFRVKRKNNQIYVSCGLWKKKNYMVPINKINAVKIEYPVIARLFGRGFLRVLNVGGEGEEVDGMKLLLLGSYEDLKRRMEIVLPEYELPDLSIRKRAPRQWMYIRGIYSLALGIACGITSFLVQVLAVVPEGEALQGKHFAISIGIGFAGMLVSLTLSFLTYKTYGIGYLEQNFLLVHGTFKKEVSLIPFERIQYICYQQGPLERCFGLQHGYVSLLASALSRYRHMGSFPVEYFEMLEQKLRETY